MTFSEDDLKAWYRAGGESMVAWVQIAEELLDPASNAPEELRQVVTTAATANLVGDLSTLMEASRALYEVFESIDPDSTPAGRLRGVLSLIDVYGSVQADAGLIPFDPRFTRGPSPE